MDQIKLIATLRTMADHLEKGEFDPAATIWGSFGVYVLSKDRASFDKNVEVLCEHGAGVEFHTDDTYLNATLRFPEGGSIQVTAERKNVCEKKKVVKEVEEDDIPEVFRPAAPAPKQEVEVPF